MQLLPFLGLGLFAITSLVIGLRLVLQPKGGDGRLPALLIGIAFLGGGGFGQPLLILGLTLERSGSPLGSPLEAIAFVSLDIGAMALWAFTWRVFRPQAAWARHLVGIAFVALAVSFFVQATSIGFSLLDRASPWYWLGFAARALGAGWAALESLRYADLMRKRLALGLADPLTTNRFLLWGMSAGAVVMSYSVTAVSFALGGSEVAMSTPVVVLSSFLGLEAAASMWLAFFPPRFYRARFSAPTDDAATGSGSA